MSKMIRGIKKDFTLMAILLIPVAIAINIVGGQVAVILKLPIYLDAIGTVLIAILAGPWVGAAAGFLSNAISSVFDPVFFPYSLVSIAVGLAAGFLARARMFSNIWKVIVSSIILALAATVVAAPITAFLFGGVTNSGSTIITGVLLATGQNLLQSVFTSQIISDLADKFVSVLISYVIIKSMSARYLARFPLGDRYIRENK